MPTTPVVPDTRDDVTKYKGIMGVGEVSHPYDMYKVRGATTDTHLVVTVTLDDLEHRNTAPRGDSEGTMSLVGFFQVQVYVNGKYKWVVNRGFAHTADISKAHSGVRISCVDVPAGTMPAGVPQRVDLVKDKVTYLIPLDCIGAVPGDRIRVRTQVIISTGDSLSFHDSKTPEFTLR